MRSRAGRTPFEAVARRSWGKPSRVHPSSTARRRTDDGSSYTHIRRWACRAKCTDASPSGRRPYRSRATTARPTGAPGTRHLHSVSLGSHEGTETGVKIHKAVIPAAGLGTRFLPATKAQPKVMLPVIDVPALQLGWEEAVRAGIDDILIVTGRGQRAIEDHFDRSIELERFLEEKGKFDELKLVRQIAELAQVHYVRQKEASGLGHAVGLAESHIADEPFVVLLGDDLIHPSAATASIMGASTSVTRSTIWRRP